jgi:hypothetical protein
MNITITNKGNYAEEGQPNPMRWMLLSKNEDGSFQNETSWLRCKDFFNDFVCARHTGKFFRIYGFDTSKMNLGNPEEPVYILLDVLTEQFVYNMGTLNTWLKDEQGMPTIPSSPQGEGKYLLTVDPVYFKNTYNVSLITLLIRLMNISYKKFFEKEKPKWDEVVKKGLFFSKFPEKLKKFVWYCGDKFNSETKDLPEYQLANLVHNNGVLNWGQYL